MEKRKIQKTGGSSYSITLPKRWVEGNRLGDQGAVSVVERASGVLTISPDRSAYESVVVNIDLDSRKSERFRRDIVAAYVAGADTIVVKSKKLGQQHRKEARKAAQVLTGMEVSEETSTKIVLKNILVDARFPYEESVSRMFSMTACMFEDALKAYSSGDSSLAEDVIARDFDIDKTFFLVSRLHGSLIVDRISESRAGVTLARARHLDRIAHELERIADHAVKISRVSGVAKNGSRKAFLRSLLDVANSIILLLSSDSFLGPGKGTESMHEVMDTLRSKENEIMRLFKSAAKGGSVADIIAVDSVDRLRGYVENMAEITLESRLS